MHISVHRVRFISYEMHKNLEGLFACIKIPLYIQTLSYCYRSHLDIKLLDYENPLQLVCKICPPDDAKKFERQSALMDHIKRDHLSEKIRPLMNSRPPYKCLFYSKCHYSSDVSVNDVINHFLDPTAYHGSVNYLKILLSNFIDHQQLKHEVSGSNLVTSTQTDNGNDNGKSFSLAKLFIMKDI